MMTKRAPVSVAIFFYAFLFLARVIDNDLLGNWENTHISQGLLGSWIWVLIKFSYWCVPIIAYLFLRGRLAKYISGTFGLHIVRSYSLLLIPLWCLVLLIEDRLTVPASDLTYFHLVTSVIATPIIEEFVFRGFLLDTLRERLPFSLANLSQALLFGCIHLPFYYALGRFGDVPLLIGNVLYLVVFAFAAGYLARSTTSLYPAIVLHAVNNLLT